MNPESSRVVSQGGSAAGTAGRPTAVRRDGRAKRIAASLGHKPPRHGAVGRRRKSTKTAAGRVRIPKSAEKTISKGLQPGRRLSLGVPKIAAPPITRPPHSPVIPPRPKLSDSLAGPVQQDAFAESPPSDEIRLVWGRSGDHAAVYHMLLAVFQAPSRDEFQAQTEDPFYEPTDRLLVKRGFRVLSHLHLTHRTMYFGSVSFPVAGFHGLSTLPEFRGQGFATRLLDEGLRRIAGDGAALALVRTRIPRFFRRSGWAVCGRHCFSQAKAREVLGRLHGEHSALLARPLSIRRWRHVEMPALVRLYQQNAQHAYGTFERTEAYWRWLVGQQAYDSLLVALDGPDKLELEETIAPIVGFGVLRQEQLVELCTAPGHPTADYQLLARACGDAIEHDRQDIMLNAPPGHPLHAVVSAAGGHYHNHEADHDEVFMVKIVDPLKFLNLLGPELDSRAKSAGLPAETELGLEIEGAKWRLISTRRGFRVRPGKLGRSYLKLNRLEFTRLALGHGSVRETAETGRIQASTQTALDLAEILFPRLPLVRPQWDEFSP